MKKEKEKSAQKKLRRELREDERRNTRDGFPAAAPVLRDLFDFLDEHLSTCECDHSLRFTREFIAWRELDEEAVVRWLEKNGGYCDSECLDNVEQVVEESMPDHSAPKSKFEN